MAVQIKRVYDPVGPRDGCRVLVDGLWPRGLKKEALAITRWMREIAPSAALRTWYKHDPKKWPAFRKKYRLELSQSPRRELLEELAAEALLQLLHLGGDGLRVPGVALEDLDGHRFALGRGEQAVDDLEPSVHAVSWVAERPEGAGEALEGGRGDVVEHEHAIFQVPGGQGVLDRPLAGEEPVHRAVEVVGAHLAEV